MYFCHDVDQVKVEFSGFSTPAFVLADVQELIFRSHCLYADIGAPWTNSPNVDRLHCERVHQPSPECTNAAHVDMCCGSLAHL